MDGLRESKHRAPRRPLIGTPTIAFSIWTSSADYTEVALPDSGSRRLHADQTDYSRSLPLQNYVAYNNAAKSLFNLLFKCSLNTILA